MFVSFNQSKNERKVKDFNVTFSDGREFVRREK